MPSTTAIVADRTDARGRVGRYEVDGAQTRVELRMRWLGVPISGVAGEVTGTIAVPDDLMSVTVRVQLDASRLAVRAGGRTLRPRLGGGADVATFEADRMEPILESFVTHDGDRPLWALVGRLTLGGVTRPTRVAVGVVRTVDDGRTVAFSGTATLRCSDFGLRGRRRLLADTVHVRVTGVAHRTDG